jgi:hypothetical protein
LRLGGAKMAAQPGQRMGRPSLRLLRAASGSKRRHEPQASPAGAKTARPRLWRRPR